MLSVLKDALRISSTDLDDELNTYISSCEADLYRVGITNIVATDPVIIQLVILYAKSQMDYQGNGERYEQAYRYMRDGYSLCGDYNEVSTCIGR